MISFIKKLFHHREDDINLSLEDCVVNILRDRSQCYYGKESEMPCFLCSAGCYKHPLLGELLKYRDLSKLKEKAYGI